MIEIQTNCYIVTCDPDFADLAHGEVVKAVPQVAARRELAPGIMLIQGSTSFGELARTWRERPPVFVRHVCPVDATVDLAASAPDLPAMVRSALESFAPRMDRSGRFSVQARVLGDVGAKPFDINTRIAAALAEASEAEVDVRQPQQVVSVVCAPGPGDGAATAYLGLSNVDDNLSDWAGGMRRFAREEGQVSRSEFKLLEALEVFGVELLPRSVALDLGASPGGWARILRQREQYVTAVDPGKLHPSIDHDPGVRHLRLTAEEYLERGPDRYDLIVNDMRMDGRDSARLMVRYAPYLYADGQAIMTLKLPERHRRTVIDHSLSILRQAYEVLGMKQLFHNRSEITLHLAPLDSPAEPLHHTP